MARSIAVAIAALAALVFTSLAPAKAQDSGPRNTAILLVLAVDASGSVNQARFELQRKGYADAFRSPRVLDAIRGGATGSIAVTMTQWTGPTLQVLAVPWTLVRDAATAPYRGLKRVIDISGDGSNNRGRDVREARDEAVRAGVIINGLPIVSLEYGLDKYYFDHVIGGPGAFIVPADSYENFAQAVLRKLILEIASND
jgi:hypothetical protein